MALLAMPMRPPGAARATGHGLRPGANPPPGVSDGGPTAAARLGPSRANRRREEMGDLGRVCQIHHKSNVCGTASSTLRLARFGRLDGARSHLTSHFGNLASKRLIITANLKCASISHR